MDCEFFKRFYLVYFFIITSFSSKATELDSLLSLLPSSKDTQSSLINLNVGKIYLKQRNFNLALLHFNKTQEISKRINYPVGEAFSLQHLGKLYSRKSSFDTSEVYYKKANLKI
jgi:tetratricopeptide (TPR) repeat protein